MKYTYAYKTSDGQRHEATLEADSREAVFTALRAQGIKAIKVVAADGSKDNGEVVVRGVRKRVVTVGAVSLVLCALCGIVAAFGLGRARSMTSPSGHESGALGDRALPPGAEHVSDEGQTFIRHMSRIAQPLPRQMIPGDRQRIEQAVASLTNAAERALAAFSEPGRPLTRANGDRPTDAEFAAALKHPLRITVDEFTESIDLKRIVTDIKVEMRNYLAGGGTISGYLAECIKRQKQEIAYRARAEEHLKKMLDGESGVLQKNQSSTVHLLSPPTFSQNTSRAYAYWLKANAQLQSMGIYPLPLPNQLREYQLSIDIEE